MMDVLRNFFGGYFHEDWRHEEDSPEKVIAAYKARAPAKELKHLQESIVAYVQAHPDDAELDRCLFSDLGCYYTPRADNMSARDWLLTVAAHLARTRTSTLPE